MKGTNEHQKYIMIIIVCGISSLLAISFMNQFSTLSANYSDKSDPAIAEGEQSDLTPRRAATFDPAFANVTLSSDPLELGQSETFTVEIDVGTGVKKVVLNIDGKDHNLKEIGGNIYQYESWLPNYTGSYIFTVEIKDDANVWYYHDDILEVVDTTASQYDKLKESNDPLELGDTEEISITVTDLSGINQVLIEYEGLNHTMSYEGGDIYEHDSWTPLSTGTYPYKIHMEDNEGNWRVMTDSITVVLDDKPPKIVDLKKIKDPLELGKNITITISVSDDSTISVVLLEFDGENHTMSATGVSSYEFKNWKPKNLGKHGFKIHVKDIYNNWNTTIGDFEVIQASTSSTEDNPSSQQEEAPKFQPLGFIVISMISLGFVVSLIAVKKKRQTAISKAGNKTREESKKKGIAPDKIQNNQMALEYSKFKDAEKHPVNVVCPICKERKKILVPVSIINEAKQLSTISLPKDLICEHHFQMFVDKNFNVRGYQKVDFQIDAEIKKYIDIVEDEKKNSTK